MISIILPTYNRANYLAQAVQTVLEQTYPHWELWVIDDGSVDDTAKIMATFSDQRIHYLYQPNQGRSAARNLGLSLAQGEQIAFLDDDDWYFPHKLEKQVLFLEQHPQLGLVGAGTEMVGADGQQLGNWLTWQDQPRLGLPDCLYACPLPISTVLIRRQWLNQLDHWFDPQLAVAEDTDFFLRLMLAGCQMAWMPELVSVYRQHPQNSQQDGQRYSRSYQQLLQKFFTQPQLSRELKLLEPKVRAYYYLIGGCLFWLQGKKGLAQEDWQLAWQWDVGLADVRADWLVEVLVGFVSSRAPSEKEAQMWIRGLLATLPASLAHLRQKERFALSLWYMGRLFRAAEPQPTDWVWGMWFGWRYWFWNRGVWALGVRAGRRLIG